MFVGGYDWSDKASVYDKYCPRYSKGVIGKTVRYIYKHGIDIKESVIADIGSGTGILTRQLLECSPQKIYAVDIDDAMHSVAKSYKSDVIYVQGSGNDTGIPDNSVDIITVGMALHWLEPKSTIAEFKRVHKPGCAIVVFSNSYLYENNNRDIILAEKKAWAQVSHKQDIKGVPQYRWKIDAINGETHCFRSVSSFKKMTKKRYVNSILTRSKSPPAHSTIGKEYIKLLGDIYDKYRPSIRKTTRASIVII